MSLKKLVRKTPWGERTIRIIPAGHPFRSVKLNPFPMPFCSYGFATKWLDPFDWNIFTWLCVLLVIPALIICVVVCALTGVTKPSITLSLIAFFGIWMGVIGTGCDIGAALGEFLRDVRNHLDVDDLQPVYGLSPSQLMDMCQQRVSILAVRLEEIEPRTIPVDKERVQAKARFDGAFYFFRKHNLIPDTSMGYYFTPRQPKAKRT